MNNRVLHSSGILPEILARFKEIFPEHADIEEYLHTVATRNESGSSNNSPSIVSQNRNASLEQAQIVEALTRSILQTQPLTTPSNNTPVSTRPVTHSRNILLHGSWNNVINSLELAEAIAMSMEGVMPEPTVPSGGSQGAASEQSPLQEATPENVDPDNMTYEGLQSLGEAIGTVSRGLPKELIANYPTQKLDQKSGWFSSGKSKPKECAICLEEYKTRDELLTLPCVHLYHKPCITRWLTDNKTCPVCNMDLSELSQL